MEAIELDFKKAFSLFKSNCIEQAHPKSCFKYGMYLLAGKECNPDLSSMIKPMRIACDGGLKQGCRYLSLVHWNGEKGRPANSELAKFFMQKACDMEDPEACWLLSTWYMGNREKFATSMNKNSKESSKQLDRTSLGSLERDMEKALSFGKRACELDVPQSCANVSRIYKIGDGVPKNIEEAMKYANKAKEIMETLQRKENSAGFTG